MEQYNDLSPRGKRLRRLWLVLIVAVCGMIMGSQLKGLLLLS